VRKLFPISYRAPGPGASSAGPLAAGVRRAGCLAFALLAACASGPAATAPAGPAAARTTLTLLGTTDVHGRVYAYDYYEDTPTDRGLAILAPIVDSIRAAHPGSVYLFDSGDWLQGNPLAYVYSRQRTHEPNAVVEAMNLLAYDAVAMGNHEFNYGLENLGRALDQAEFPVLSVNAFRAGTDEHAFPPSVLLDHVTARGDTVAIGVAGVVPPGVAIWDRPHVQGVLEFRDITTSLAPVVADLRSRGADLVVVLAHSGLEGSSYDTAATGLPPENQVSRIAREVEGVDLVLMGHSHGEIADTVIAGVHVVQPKNWGESLAEVTVDMERGASGAWRVTSIEGRLHRGDPSRPDTAFVDSLRWEHERTLAYVRSVVGRSTGPMSTRLSRVRDTPAIDFINEVQRRVAGTDLSAAAAFTTEADVPQGDVRVADIAGLYIYDNTLKGVRIGGEALRAFLERSASYFRTWPVPEGASMIDPEQRGYNFDMVSGVDYVIDVSRPAGQRIVELTRDGRRVTAADTFTLALNSYRQQGGGGFDMVASAPVVYNGQREMRELLFEEVGRTGEVDPRAYFRQSWRIIPEAAAAYLEREAEAASAQAEGGSAGAAASGGRIARLRVLATNDLHGSLLATRPDFANGREVGGAAALVALYRAEASGFAGPTIRVSGGDMYQGTPISNLTDGRSTIAFYNAAGYDAAAIGNHEFDWGIETLAARREQARFPFLGANIFVAGTDSMPPWAAPVARVVARSPNETDSVRVAIIGLATEETPYVTRRSNVAHLEFRDVVETVDAWVPLLRAEGHDFVIVIGHVGAVCDGDACSGEVIDLARGLTHAPDLIVGGHTHRPITRVVNGIPVVEAGSRGTRYSVVDLWRAPGEDRAHAWIRGLPTTYADLVPPDSAVAALVADALAEIGPRVDAVVATLAAPLDRSPGEYPLGRLIADAQRERSDADIALMNNGGIRAGLPAGDVTWGMLYQVQPFENRMVRLRLTGAQVLETLETALADGSPDLHVSGLRVTYDPSLPAGERVLSAVLDDGPPLEPAGTYRVAVNDFMAQRGDGYEALGEPLEREELDLLDIDALVDYLSAQDSPVRAPAEPRFIDRGGAG
jgi:2',3'-cyclic-nucleotide 2'-phosphodiesterase/3'-nucleotidase/5'-nucleotidase